MPFRMCVGTLEIGPNKEVMVNQPANRRLWRTQVVDYMTQARDQLAQEYAFPHLEITQRESQVSDCLDLLQWLLK